MAFTYKIDRVLANTPGSTLTNFVFRIDETFAVWKDVAHGGHIQHSSGYDWGVYDGLTKWNHQLILYNNTTGHLVADVQIPSWAGASKPYQIQYGDSTVSVDPSTRNTWDTLFELVAKYEDGTTLDVSDFGQNNDASGNFGSAPATTGQSGGAASFDGISQHIGYALSADISPPLTLSAWFKRGSAGATGMIVHAGYFSTPPTVFNAYYMYINATGTDVNTGSAGSFGTGSYQATNDTNWHYYAARFASTSSRQSILDGTIGTLDTSTVADPSPLPNIASIAATRQDSGAYVQNFFTGSIDEVRIARESRSDDWLLQEYNSINNPSAFSTGSTETLIKPTIDLMHVPYFQAILTM